MEQDNQSGEGKFFDTKSGKNRTRLISLFVLGLIIGIALKTNAIKFVTIGFEDFKLKELRQDFNLKAEKEEQAATEEQKENEQQQEEQQGAQNNDQN